MKYKSTLARGLSHAWPWTKPIGSSPTASRLLRYSLFFMLVLLCGGSAWAKDATATFDLTAKNAPLTREDAFSDIKVVFSDGCSTGAAGYVKFPKKNTCTISIPSTGTITGITFTYTAKDYSPSKQTGVAFTADAGTFNAQATETTSTWTGSANSIVFTNDATSGFDLRVSEIKVTYTTTAATHNEYKTLTFPDDNSANNKVITYTDTWIAKNGTDEWSITNFNNNQWNNSWKYIKCGSKKMPL